MTGSERGVVEIATGGAEAVAAVVRFETTAVDSAAGDDGVAIADARAVAPVDLTAAPLAGATAVGII